MTKPLGDRWLLLQLANLGGRSYRKTIGKFDEQYTIEDYCNLCGVCKKVCPVNNITVEEHVEFHHQCIGCFACTHNCPQGVIRFEREKSKARYRHTNITLKEIVDANL